MDLNVVPAKLRSPILLFLLVIFSVLGNASSHAVQSVTLVWNASPDTNVIGYKVYYGTASRTYSTQLDAGSATNLAITGLSEGVTYYFAATAYNIVGLESDYSAEVSYTVPGAPVNQAPTLNPISNLTIGEDASQQNVNLSGISAGASNEVQTLTVTASSSNPSLIPNPTVVYSSPASTGTLSFKPAANAFGSATISVTVSDGASVNSTVVRTFVVTVASVNDAPTLNAPGNLTINEDAGIQSVSLADISSGAANESQTLVVTASSSNPGLIPNPAVSYSSPAATGVLTFTPVANAFGTATITVSVNDNGASNNLVTRTFTVTVNSVNDTPTLNPISSISLGQNAGLQTVNLGGIGSGNANENQTLSVSASSSNPSIVPNPTVTYSSPNATGTLTFTPSANSSGSAIITVTVNDGGSANNTITRTFSVTVNQMNNAPTLNPLGNISVSENSGSKTVSLSGISSGSSNEVQTLTVTASSSNAGLIPAPTITYTSPGTSGTLMFTPVTNAFGTATITVTVNDGGLSNNIVTRSFTVTVNAVNQAPTLNPVGNLAIARNAGLQTVNLSGISSGAANESQTLNVTAVSSDTSLIPNPTVTYSSPNLTGKLTFTPVFLATGSAVVTVTVNDGGASNNIVTRAFTVTVNAPPTISSIPSQTIAVNSNTPPLAFTIADSETPAANLSVWADSSSTALVPTNNINFGGGGSNRTVRVTPLAGKSGAATITLYVSDGLLTASTSFSLNVLTAPTAPQTLTILTEGGGSVSGATSGQALTAGKTYTLTAVAQEGQEFVGWSGSISSSSSKIKFAAVSNMVVRARFVPSPFKLGNYAGLFYEEDQVRLGRSGNFTLLVTRHGAYSGRLMLGASRITVSGKFGLDCLATNAIVRKGATPLLLRLRLGTNEAVGQVFGELTDGGWVAQLRGDRSAFGKTNAAPYAGFYTLVLPGSENGSSNPAGHGYGTVNVNAMGTALFSGLLADGTKITQSAPLSKFGTWPFYASISKGQGAVVSWFTFNNESDEDVSGTLSWIKNPSSLAKFYPGGINEETEATGSRFIAPIGSNVLNASAAKVRFDGGSLPLEFENAIQLAANNLVSNLGTNALSIVFTPTKGTFKGKVTVPGTTSSYSFGGVVHQKGNRGYGFLMGAGQTSAVEIRPE